MKKILVLTLVALFIGGCSTQNFYQKTVEKIDSQKIQIVASFYPLAFMAEQIGGENVEVVDLAGTQEVHEYTPSPQDMVKLNHADLVIVQGIGLEPWADGLIPTLEKSGVLVAQTTQGLDLLKIEKDEDYEEEHEEEHPHGEFNPHTWLDPVLAQKMGQDILNALIKVDPKNAKIYKVNSQGLNKKFEQLDTSFQKGLSQCTRHEVMVSHDAMGYLEKRYHFKAYGIAGISTEDTPSAKILAALKEKSKTDNITHILVEDNSIRRFADTLAAETGLKTLSFNPLEQDDLKLHKDFFERMNDNLKNLKIALNCQ